MPLELPVDVEDDAKVGEVGALAPGRRVVRVDELAAVGGPLVESRVPVLARGG